MDNDLESNLLNVSKKQNNRKICKMNDYSKTYILMTICGIIIISFIIWAMIE
jgi:hypothetical protein